MAEDATTGDADATDAADAADAAPSAGPHAAPPWWTITGVVVVVAVLAVTVVGGLLTRDDAAAATVNGHDISISSVNDFLRGLRSHPQFRAQAEQSGQALLDASGHFTAYWGATAVGTLVVERLYDEAIAARHLRVTAADIAAVPAPIRTFYRGFPSKLAESLTRLRADEAVLERKLGGAAPLNALVRRMAQREHLRVDPRYGTVDVRNGGLVVPPAVPTVRDERGAGSDTSPLLGG
jgi:SurA N-terminal domain